MVNALPVKDGWGPLPSLEAYSQALPSRCLGAVYVRTAAGFFSVIAGTKTGLYRLNATTLAWDDISGAGGPFNVADADRWSFARFGQLLVATQINNDPQVYDIDAGSNFAPMGGNPPRAKYAWAAGSFLVLGHLQGLPSRCQWCGLEDLSFWEVGKRGSDYQDLPDGEDITGGIPEPQGAVILQRRAIRQMRFMGGEYTFGFTVINPARGCVAPHSIVQIRAGDYVYLTEDGFFRGSQGQAIGAERVDRTFLNLADLDDFALVRGVNDPIEKTVWWQFTRAGLATQNLIGYDW
ncbi:MAG: hypothetical protein QNJ43_26405, partial [Breoghania sp.]|nr:hypothetical protein [Breoghania sp.]